MKIVAATEVEIAAAAEALRAGQLVGLPTETVYGLAGVATDVEAVRRIFAAKRRPMDNPLIVHVANLGQVATVAAEIPDIAVRLGEALWPGPLTLVLPRGAHIPRETTGGLDTVAVRIPAHPIALDLIRETDRPLAAPSANTFMGLSPTRVQDIDPEIVAQTAVVLDGGPTTFGIESTVVAVSPEVRILRPGSISRAEIEALLGMTVATGSSERLAPGQYPRHYAPQTRLVLIDDLGDRPGLGFSAPGANQIQMPQEPRGYAIALYASLRELDRLNLPVIYVESPPMSPEWEAVWDRLDKASS